VLLSFTNKGKVHITFGDIGYIIMKVTGLQDDDNKSNEQEQDKIPLTALSKDTKAFEGLQRVKNL
jgi:hypothetical protein